MSDRSDQQPAPPTGDRTCLMWLRDGGHVCRAESGAPLGPRGGRCATWARVQMARHDAATRHGPEDQQVAASHTVALLAETHSLLVSAAPYADTHEHLAQAWDRTAQAFLRADQAAALAGWYARSE